MDNLINNEWLEGLEEIRKINAEFQDDNEDGAEDLSPQRKMDKNEAERPSSRSKD